MATTIQKTLAVDAQPAVDGLDRVTEAAEKTSKSLKDNKESSKDFGKTLNELKDQFSLNTIASNLMSNGMKGLKSSLSMVVKEMWAMVANPIGAILAAIAITVGTLYNLFKGFAPLVDKVQQGFAAMGAVLSTVKAAFVGLISGTQSLSESFKGLGGAMAQAARDAAALKKAEQDLADQQDILEVQNADLDAQYNKLILQSKNRTLSEKERIAILDQASKIEEQIFNNNKALADEEYRQAIENIRINNKLTATEVENLKTKGIAYAKELEDAGRLSASSTEEDLKRLKDAQKKEIEIINQSTQLREKAQNRRDQLADDAKAKANKDLEDEKKSKEEEIAAENKARELYQESRNKLYEWTKKRQDKEKEDAKKLTDFKIAMIDYETQKQMEATAKKEKDIQDWKDKQQRETENRLAFDMNNEKLSYQNRIDNATKYFDTLIAAAKKNGDDIYILEQEKEDAIYKLKQEKFQQAADLARQSVDFIQNIDQTATNVSIALLNNKLKNGKISQEEYQKQLEKIQEKAARREKAYAISKAIIDTAAGISAHLKDPFPLNIIQIAFAAATGAAQIAKILSTPIKSEGGSVGGVSTGSASGGEGTAPNTSFTFTPVQPATNTQVAKTYVIGKDVSNQQQLDRQIIANGSL